MQRRRFLQLVSTVAAGSALGSLGACATPRRFTGWTWVHGGNPGTAADWKARFTRLRSAGLTGVLVSGGDVDLLSDTAHEAGLVFHRWLWILNRNGDSWVQEHHPEWFSVSRNGDSSLTTPPYVPYYKWVCPTREPVREYLRTLVDEVASHPGVDGVHLDYIRHPDVILPRGLWAKYGLIQDREYPEFDFCYCDVCRPTFEALSGTDPLEFDDPTEDVQWREFRWNSVTETVRVLADAVRGRGKEISAAVFPTPAIARRLVRQAWDQWPVDAVFPMLYHGFYEESIEWIGETAAEGVAAISPSESLYAGLYLPDLDPNGLGRAVDEAKRAGASGVALFEMGGATDRHLAALTSYLD